MKLLIICGPTATGKTSLGIRLAKKFNGELVSADSRQAYKGLDALTGKERSDEIPIHLYDVADPGKEFTQHHADGAGFSVAHFVRLAHAAFDSIAKKGKLPIVVGGTGFYLRALDRPPQTMTIPPDWSRRKHLETLSVDALQKLVDPARLSRMNDSDRKNPRRLIRAIEVAGKTPSRTSPTYDALWIGLTAPLSILRQRISERIAKRFDAAVREFRPGLPPILSTEALLGYTRGECSKEEAMTKWAQAEYDYARRQMTWFRKEKQIHWFDVSKEYMQDVEVLVEEWYTGSA